jgi:hypothetical protein
MHYGKYVFNQFMSNFDRYDFQKYVDKYSGDSKSKGFKCWDQFMCLCFGQLTHRESLRDVVSCLNANRGKLFHLGFRSNIVRSTLAYANETKNWRIYRDYAYLLIKKARNLYVDDFDIKIDNSIYVLDSSIISLCLNVFSWAKFRKTKSGIKLHTLLDLRDNIPVVINITPAQISDVSMLDRIEFEDEAIYVMDRGYIDFKRLYALHNSGSYFIIRLKSNIRTQRIYSNKKAEGVIYDQIVWLKTKQSRANYPEKLRVVKIRDEDGNSISILTNNFSLDTTVLSLIYRYRWQIEIFFKWIKQNLKIKVFWGYSENAVLAQIWIAVCVYLMATIIKKEMKLKQSLHEILQILSVYQFAKMPINELFQADGYNPDDVGCQLSLLDNVS